MGVCGIWCVAECVYVCLGEIGGIWCVVYVCVCNGVGSTAAVKGMLLRQVCGV